MNLAFALVVKGGISYIKPVVVTDKELDHCIEAVIREHEANERRAEEYSGVCMN